jgi:AcrR family transcriptional regulator
MTRKYESTGTRQKQIADAAAKIIVKYGSEHVTTKKIAQEVGISETAIYRHFKNKTDLLAFLIKDVEKTLLAEIVVDNVQPMTLEYLEKIVNVHIDKVIQRKGISFQVIAEIISLGSKRLNVLAFTVTNKYINKVRNVFELGREAGVIRRDINLEAAATLFFGMIQGLVSTWALSQYKFNLEEKFISSWKIFRESILSK